MTFKTIKEISINNKGYYGIGASSCKFDSSFPSYLRITDITDDGCISHPLKTCINTTIYPNWNKYLLKENDIVFARTGSVGRNYFCNRLDRQTVFAGFLIKFSINKDLINPRYVAYYCQSNNYWNQIKSLFTGTTRPNINAEQYNLLKIPLFDQDIQQHIVNTIGTIDDLIECNQKFLLNFQVLLSIKFKEYCSIIKDKNNLSFFIFRTGKSLKKREWIQSDVIDLSTMPYNSIFIENFSKGVNFATNIKTIGLNDLIYGSIRPYFKKAGFNWKTNYVVGSVFSFNVINENNYLWILATICSEDFHNFTNRNSYGTKMPIINWETFVSYKLPYSKREVKSFVKIMKPLFDLAVTKLKQNHQLKIIKNNLLKKYF